MAAELELGQEAFAAAPAPAPAAEAAEQLQLGPGEELQGDWANQARAAKPQQTQQGRQLREHQEGKHAQETAPAGAVLLVSDVYSPDDQLPEVKARAIAATADGTLAAQLFGIGLELVPDSGGWAEEPPVLAGWPAEVWHASGHTQARVAAAAPAPPDLLSPSHPVS